MQKYIKYKHIDAKRKIITIKKIIHIKYKICLKMFPKIFHYVIIFLINRKRNSFKSSQQDGSSRSRESSN